MYIKRGSNSNGRRKGWGRQRIDRHLICEYLFVWKQGKGREGGSEGGDDDIRTLDFELRRTLS